MAVTVDPTVDEIVTEGLKRGGRVSPSATDIANAKSHQLQEVKADITLAAGRSPSLVATELRAIVKGASRHSWPVSADQIKSLQLVATTTTGGWNSTAQAGGAASITLVASFDQQSDNVIGRYIFITAGTGSGQFQQIISYDNTTKIAGVDASWTTTPNATSAYFIETYRYNLWNIDRVQDWNHIQTPYVMGIPTSAAMDGRTILFDYAPDTSYVLLIHYWFALDQVDEADSLFIKHLRRYRSLWIQGVAVKTMQRYDEDRYSQELVVYNSMLSALAGVSSEIYHMTPWII